MGSVHCPVIVMGVSGGTRVNERVGVRHCLLGVGLVCGV